ncbi:MAG TPA: helix-turn-helix transcriptional regulator [Clostridiaceae bacterium]|nr:helix-turn-helix transcriptional regulator [Clostridiaceae bacterium]
MEDKIIEIAERIRGLREDFGIPVAEMAQLVEVSEEEYLQYEEGKRDFSFTFLYKVANRLSLDISELITGSSPTLSVYTHVKKGKGLSIQRRKGFKYQSLAYLFRNRNAEPFLVEVPYDEDADKSEIVQRSHDGQEFDYILSGSLKVKIDDHEFIMEAGDSVYYDASHRHGMVATNGESCLFLAVVIKDQNGRMG